VGLLEGRDPKLRGQAVLFTAHYDHLGTRDGKVLPGADDDASGTAAVIELARVFVQDSQRTKRTLVFVAFGGEETGLLGSYYYAAHPLAATRAVINLDMIGRDEMPSTQTNGLIEIAADTSNELNFIGLKSSPGLRGALERANRTVGLRFSYKWDDDAALNVLWRGDQFPFLLKGVPAVWLFNGFQPDYHTPSDTIDKLNFTKMVKIVRLAYLAGRALANQ
jgi:Zn-dependent M28 family amino/carboxypeptidase